MNPSAELARGLPSGWTDCHLAMQPLFRRLRDALQDADPTPWLASRSEAFWGTERDQNEAKLSIRAAASFHRAFVDGVLTPSASNGRELKRLPKNAFANYSSIQGGLFLGTFEIDPLWPDDWQDWNNLPWAIPSDQFEHWMASPEAVSADRLPLATELTSNRANQIECRAPSQRAYVPLSEAITWIAFGIALDSGRLTRTIGWESLCGGNFAEVRRLIEEAGSELLDAGADAKVSFLGRHVATMGQIGALTQKIDPEALHDYRQINIYSHDHLSYGHGLSIVRLTANSSKSIGSLRTDFFTHVTVNRKDLLKHFPGSFDLWRARLATLPVKLDGVGPIIGLEEALCRTAFGTPSRDYTVWQDASGRLTLTDAGGRKIEDISADERAAEHAAIQAAHASLHRALLDGTLATYVAPENAAPITIPRLYWSRASSELLDPIYRGVSLDDEAVGNVVMLSLEAFDSWLRARWPAPLEQQSDRRAPAYKSARPPSDETILAKAEEMKLRGLDGRTIARTMRFEPGFESVATTTVRDLIKGRWKPPGRPSKRSN